jgi:phosphoglycolate phosphatase-like HAD superfamily hydrolase
MRPTVLLFDIDGTLVTTGGAGGRAIRRAFETLHGRADACAFRFDGMTDRAIVRQGLLNVGAPTDEAAIDAVLQAYLEVLSEEVSKADSAKYRLHAGMERAVGEALSREGFAVGLGTGNIKEGARIKLQRVGIYDRFAFGGFGCDHEDRTELIRAGAQRGADRLGAPLAECRVVVVGDTPKDVLAAKGIGAQCLGVGTGAFTAEALREHGAELAVADLLAPGAVAWLLGEGAASAV